ncbi:hypothetical protein CQW23_31465 [Capsicum baccatum]|uniref:Uncharacterized protein n=1 Tax=Capsicum baccatum TaxID=33114 RepID=A0A2G2V7H5_CAPBA|nr:hypothetical protein CQW23_31465 [Capsicum baccatum]
MVSNSGKGELGSSSLSWSFDEKENESKAAKLKSPAKGSKNFMSMTISASSKIAQSQKKKILVERNDPIRTSITLSDGKPTFYYANSEEHNKNSKKVMEPKETVLVPRKDSTRMVSNSRKEELGSSSLSWGFDEKENESKAVKLKSPAKEETFTEATVDQEKEPAMPVAKQIDEPALPVAEGISEA